MKKVTVDEVTHQCFFATTSKLGISYCTTTVTTLTFCSGEKR